MNRHTKLAIFVAPFLMVIGYIGSDYFLEYQAEQTQLYQLEPDGPCYVLAEECVLKSNEFKINVLDKNGTTIVNSTFPLDAAILFLVDENDVSDAYALSMGENPYYWQSETPLRQRHLASKEKQKLRIIATIKGGKYISEFYSQR
ncbi:hypothetical protein [Aliikangiella coralliicola]|uniref:Uncharacterized protein n=1 Tax=Aliikangiella coralliicola TaxID=2592383 RepID=A0A545UCW4_9GAMM|nr:hypothetical protein [Aliikangiella coralliicola]TQV87302.1 hypothetical protein FLL46_12700 [Aliikangiella coralliicola]